MKIRNATHFLKKIVKGTHNGKIIDTLPNFHYNCTIMTVFGEGVVSINFIICDDNPIFLNELQKQILSVRPDCGIELLATAEQALLYLRRNSRSTDAAFIDIRLESSNGIELAAEISELYPSIRIVFVTNFGNEYYEDVFLSVKPFAILKKPIKQDYLEAHLKHLENDISSAARMLSIRFNSITYDIPLASIIYAVSDKRKIHIHTSNAVYDTYEKLDELQKRLGSSFVRCQKSYAINLHHVCEMDISSFRLTNGASVNISKPYRKAAKEAYFKHHIQAPETNQAIAAATTEETP